MEALWSVRDNHNGENYKTITAVVQCEAVRLRGWKIGEQQPHERNGWGAAPVRTNLSTPGLLPRRIEACDATVLDRERAASHHTKQGHLACVYASCEKSKRRLSFSEWKWCKCSDIELQYLKVPTLHFFSSFCTATCLLFNLIMPLHHCAASRMTWQEKWRNLIDLI